jgi:hypothetical protein
VDEPPINVNSPISLCVSHPSFSSQTFSSFFCSDSFKLSIRAIFFPIKLMDAYISIEILQKAIDLAASQFTSEKLFASAPYSNSFSKRRRKPSCPNSVKTNLKWAPLGDVAKIVVTDADFLESTVDGVLPASPVSPNLIAKLHSFRFDKNVYDMALWFVSKGLASWVVAPPNCGAYTIPKEDSDKVRVITDCHLLNELISINFKAFVLFSPETIKPLLRKAGPTFFCSFDFSNFFHSFVAPPCVQRLIPILYKIVCPDGKVRTLRALRLVFGSLFSPILTHVVISRVLGLPHRAYIKGLQPKPSASIMSSPLEISALYVDDDIEASKSSESICGRFDSKMDTIRKHNVFIKPTSIKRNVNTLNFAGKHFNGWTNQISNVDKNVAKVLALTIRLLSSKVDQFILLSFIGSVGFLTSHRRWAFPFLNSINLLAAREFPPQCLSPILMLDALSAFAMAVIPWSSKAEFTWVERIVALPTIFVDAQVDFALVGVVIADLNGQCRSMTVDIPHRFRDSQQSAEMYGIKVAINLGWNLFGGKFNLASDSISSVMGLLKPRMATGSLPRNVIIRSILMKMVFREFAINFLWVPSEFNPSDDPSRAPNAIRNSFVDIPFSSVSNSFNHLYSSDSFLSRNVSGDCSPGNC